jgi:hypothetical protein
MCLPTFYTEHPVGYLGILATDLQLITTFFREGDPNRFATAPKNAENDKVSPRGRLGYRGFEIYCEKSLSFWDVMEV